MKCKRFKSFFPFPVSTDFIIMDCQGQLKRNSFYSSRDSDKANSIAVFIISLLVSSQHPFGTLFTFKHPLSRVDDDKAGRLTSKNIGFETSN